MTEALPRIRVGTSRSSFIGRARYGALLWHPSATEHMATMMAPVEQREVLRCDHCGLVQFRAGNDNCRKCRKPLDIDEPEPVTVPRLSIVPPASATERDGIQVATAVRDLRRVRNLSQRQLAGRMNVPRTYISKIENGKAMPTLSSLERLARALQVEISALLRDTKTRQRDEAAVLLNDPFLAEIAGYCAQLDALQKSICLNHVRELASGRRRMA